MNFYSFGSSSSGNCYLLEFEKFNILIDIGIHVANKIANKNFMKLRKVRYLLISHEHIDHTRYLKQFMRFNLKTKVIINYECYLELLKKGDKDFYIQNEKRFRFLNHNKVLYNEKENYWLYAFRVLHNSAANNGYIIQVNNKKIIFYTDCGNIKHSSLKLKLLNWSDLILVESNYIETFQAKTLKHTIQKSELGHSSRLQTYEFLKFLKEKTKQKQPRVVLIHTSAECYRYPEIYDEIYNDIGWLHSRAPKKGYYEIENI